MLPLRPRLGPLTLLLLILDILEAAAQLSVRWVTTTILLGDRYLSSLSLLYEEGVNKGLFLCLLGLLTILLRWHIMRLLLLARTRVSLINVLQHYLLLLLMLF